MTLFYLSPENWSPRYDHTFFTVKLESAEERSSLPPGCDDATRVDGNRHLPAVYYQINVFCEHQQRTVYRRFSQFKSMYQELRRSPPVSEETSVRASHAHDVPLDFPPGTCFFQKQNEEFKQNRLGQLQEFVQSLLQRPGYSKHQGVIAFFELDAFEAQNHREEKTSEN